MNNILENRENVSQKIADNLYKMGIYREYNVDDVVQFDINHLRFIRIDNRRLEDYIISQSPSLAINLFESILNHLPMLSENSNIYNNYMNLKNKVDFDYIDKINQIVNDKYYLDKSYLDLSKSEKDILKTLAKEHIYYCGSSYRPNREIKGRCENNCFIKHQKGLEFKYISLYDVFGKEEIEQFNFTKWGDYLINIDMDKIRDYFVLTNFKEEHSDLINYVNKEMGL